MVRRKTARAKPKRAPKKRRARRAFAAEVVIPDKLYFRIGEVSRLCRLPAYVLRFWETEFPQLKPVMSATGQRMYRRREIELLLRIKRLLYEQGFTIPGARQQLRSDVRTGKTQPTLPFPASSSHKEAWARLRHEMKEILGLLNARRA